MHVRLVPLLLCLSVCGKPISNQPCLVSPDLSPCAAGRPLLPGPFASAYGGPGGRLSSDDKRMVVRMGAHRPAISAWWSERRLSSDNLFRRFYGCGSAPLTVIGRIFPLCAYRPTISAWWSERALVKIVVSTAAAQHLLRRSPISFLVGGLRPHLLAASITSSPHPYGLRELAHFLLVVCTNSMSSITRFKQAGWR